ncbi:MAG: GNAT family N-acetyltransferase [Micavibrio sp.]
MSDKSPYAENAYRLLPVQDGDADREREFLILMHDGFHDGELDFDWLRQFYLKPEKNRQHYVLQFNDAAIGAATLQDQGDGWSYLTNVTIRPSCRKQNHGQALVRNIESLAARFGQSALCLAAGYEVSDFYERLGYQYDPVGYGAVAMNRMFKILSPKPA